MASLVALKKVLIIVASVLGVLVLVAGIAYAADAPMDAKITEKQCAGPTSTVSIETLLFGIPHTLEMPPDKCAIIQPGNVVRYHLRSAHTIIYSAVDGPCVFDSQTIVCTT